MPRFSPSDPFPLWRPGTFSYAEAQAHAHEADGFLGLEIDRVERSLIDHGCRVRALSRNKERQELWIGLAAKSLLTPYTEIRDVIERLNPKPGQTIIDLGAAYGRMAFVLGRHFAQTKFIGYEYVGERVQESRRCLQRWGHSNAQMEHADLAAPDFAPAPADIYFIYDYGTPKAIEKTLFDLRKISRAAPIVVVARGERCREAIENRHQWLLKVSGPTPSTKSTIYRAWPEAGARRVSEASHSFLGETGAS